MRLTQTVDPIRTFRSDWQRPTCCPTIGLSYNWLVVLQLALGIYCQSGSLAMSTTRSWLMVVWRNAMVDSNLSTYQHVIIKFNLAMINMSIRKIKMDLLKHPILVFEFKCFQLFYSWMRGVKCWYTIIARKWNQWVTAVLCHPSRYQRCGCMLVGNSQGL